MGVLSLNAEISPCDRTWGVYYDEGDARNRSNIAMLFHRVASWLGILSSFPIPFPQEFAPPPAPCKRLDIFVRERPQNILFQHARISGALVCNSSRESAVHLSKFGVVW